MNRNNQCFVCKALVLGIEGQDTVFDTYLLSEADKSILLEEAYGHCHFNCLQYSSFSKIWASKLNRYIKEVLKIPVVAETDNLTIYFHERLQEFRAIRQDGVKYEAKISALRSASIVEGGYLIPVEEDWYLDLKGNRNLTQEIQEKLINDGKYSIPKILKGLLLEHKLIFPIAIENGELKVNNLKQKKAKLLLQSWTKDSVAAKAAYFKFIPKEVGEFIINHPDKF
jgi:hypothetical protein